MKTFEFWMILIGISFLAGLAYSDYVENPKLTEEKIYVAWMRKHSDMDNDTLIRVYRAVKDHPKKDMLLALGVVESNYNPTAKSPSNARGIWQVIPYWWEDELNRAGIIVERRDFWNIEKNGQAAIYIFNKYVAKFGSPEKALARYLGHECKETTKKYVAKVNKYEKSLQIWVTKFKEA